MGETIFIFVLLVIAIILLVHKSGNIKPNFTFDQIRNQDKENEIKNLEHPNSNDKRGLFRVIVIGFVCISAVCNMIWWFMTNTNYTTIEYKLWGHLLFSLPTAILLIFYYILSQWSENNEFLMDKKYPVFYKFLAMLSMCVMGVYFVVFMFISTDINLVYFLILIFAWMLYFFIEYWDYKINIKNIINMNTKNHIRSEARKRLREAKCDFEEGFLTQEEYQRILDENKPKII